ncbi:MAG: hypothetical protein ACYDCK_11045, partial [Thermoplasmatota archaeon]
MSSSPILATQAHEAPPNASQPPAQPNAPLDEQWNLTMPDGATLNGGLISSTQDRVNATYSLIVRRSPDGGRRWSPWVNLSGPHNPGTAWNWAPPLTGNNVSVLLTDAYVPGIQYAKLRAGAS